MNYTNDGSDKGWMELGCFYLRKYNVDHLYIKAIAKSYLPTIKYKQR